MPTECVECLTNLGNVLECVECLKCIGMWAMSVECIGMWAMSVECIGMWGMSVECHWNAWNVWNVQNAVSRGRRICVIIHHHQGTLQEICYPSHVTSLSGNFCHVIRSCDSIH